MNRAHRTHRLAWPAEDVKNSQRVFCCAKAERKSSRTASLQLEQHIGAHLATTQTCFGSLWAFGRSFTRIWGDSPLHIVVMLWWQHRSLVRGLAHGKAGGRLYTAARVQYGSGSEWPWLPGSRTAACSHNHSSEALVHKHAPEVYMQRRKRR